MNVPKSLMYTSSTYRNYSVSFHDDAIYTTVTHTASVVDDWIGFMYRIHRRKLHRLIVGLDIEWSPSFKRRNPVAIIQLCVGRRCLIFQLIHADKIPHSLFGFLNRSEFTYVGVGIRSDVAKLRADYGLWVRNPLNLQDLAADEYGDEGLRRAGLKTLARVVLEKEIEKPRNVTLSDWSGEWLSIAQVQYACLDAFLSFDIARVLFNG